jgi:A/G-specific adenine glycosylase
MIGRGLFTDEQKLKFFQATLLDWFQNNGRDFPWRNEKDPFKILIAEVMLQRTKADQVAPVYSDFIKEFSSSYLLANSHEESVNKYIKKIGLTNRGKNLIKMASEIERLIDKVFPHDRAKLEQFTGIGNYISTAIAVYAFNMKHVAVDSNVIRLVSRFFGIDTKKEVRRNSNFLKYCQSLVSDIENEDIKKFNWSLLDFSALVCKTKPLCTECPLVRQCSYTSKFINNT